MPSGKAVSYGRKRPNTTLFSVSKLEMELKQHVGLPRREKTSMRRERVIRCRRPLLGRAESSTVLRCCACAKVRPKSSKHLLDHFIGPPASSLWTCFTDFAPFSLSVALPNPIARSNDDHEQPESIRRNFGRLFRRQEEWAIAGTSFDGLFGRFRLPNHHG